MASETSYVYASKLAENDLVAEAGAEEGDGNTEVLETEGEHFQRPCLLALRTADRNQRPLVERMQERYQRGCCWNYISNTLKYDVPVNT